MAQNNSSSVNEAKKSVKEEEMKITELQVIPGDDPVLATFDVILERPYFAQGKKNSDINAGAYINLLTKNSISFTKGLVLKKHLVTKRGAKSQEGTEAAADDNDDEEDGETETPTLSAAVTGGASAKSKASNPMRKKNKSNIYLQYIVQFQNVNKINFSADSLGGLNYLDIDWSIEMETFSTYQFNIMRNNLQNLCTSATKHALLRQHLIMNKKP